MDKLLGLFTAVLLFAACNSGSDSTVSGTQSGASDCSAVFREGVVYDPKRTEHKSMRNRIPEQFQFTTHKSADGTDILALNISEKLKIEVEHKDACKIMSDWRMSVGLSKKGRVTVGFAEDSAVKVKDSFPIFFFAAAATSENGSIVRIAPVVDTPDNKKALEVFSVPMQAPAGMPAGAPPLIIEGFFMNSQDYVYFQSQEVADFFALLTQRLNQPMKPFDPPGLTQYNQIIPQLRQMSGLQTVPLELKW